MSTPLLLRLHTLTLLSPTTTNIKTRRRFRVNSVHHKSLIVLPTTRILPIACHSKSHDHHNHDHDHDHAHHHHGHGHHHGELTKPQQVFADFAKAVKWTDMADFLREHLELCCFSTVVFISAAVCPYLLPKSVPVKAVQHLLALVAFPLVGISASYDALLDIAGGKVNIHVLMALAAFASAFMGNSLEGGLLLAMFNLAHIAEEYFTSKSKVDVKELKENYPEFALVLDVNNQKLLNLSDLKYHEVPVTELSVGSFILVKAGESVPVDCEVFHGRSTITIEHLTGEVKPVERDVGDSIPGGARNIDGMMILKAKKTWKESMLNKIVQLTEEAQLRKPTLQRWLDQFGENYSKAVIILSVAVALIGPILFKWPFFSTPASPCALAVAPLAYATAISACAKK
ncbi:probable cadmium/zinc-transporting ATPase HMA1, chloroplastic, partial [Tanacetum coccineum]